MYLHSLALLLTYLTCSVLVLMMASLTGAVENTQRRKRALQASGRLEMVGRPGGRRQPMGCDGRRRPPRCHLGLSKESTNVAATLATPSARSTRPSMTAATEQRHGVVRAPYVAMMLAQGLPYDVQICASR